MRGKERAICSSVKIAEQMAEVKNTVFTLPATLPVVRHQLKFDSYIQRNPKVVTIQK